MTKAMDKSHMRFSCLVFASLTLVGCSNSPSSGDVERVLHNATTSCQNVEVTEVKKTDAYEQDGYYRVEYTYTVVHKNHSGLKNLEELWLAERQRDAEFVPALRAHEQRAQVVKDEIAMIESSLKDESPRSEQFSATGRPWRLTEDENRAYAAALTQWHEMRDAATGAKRKELDELERAWREERAKVPRAQLLGVEGNAMLAFISQGCSQAGRKFVEGLFEVHRSTVGASEDKGDWFNEHEARMNGSMGMRKTESGWRALSEAL